MTPVFRGRFEVKLDSKGRLSLPPAVRKVLSSKKSNSLVITNSIYNGKRCLDAYSLKSWEALEKSISKRSSLNASVQAYQRFYLSGGQVVDRDAQNRVLVPQSLRKYANILDSKEVVIVGMGRKFEIWSLEEWNHLYQSMSENFEKIQSEVSDLKEEGE